MHEYYAFQQILIIIILQDVSDHNHFVGARVKEIVIFANKMDDIGGSRGGKSMRRYVVEYFSNIDNQNYSTMHKELNTQVIKLNNFIILEFEHSSQDYLINEEV